MGTAGYMHEILLLGKIGQFFRAELWAIIGPDRFRYPISREHCLETVNESLSRSGYQFFHFRKALEIVYYHQVVFSFEVKQVCGNHFPRVVWEACQDQGFFLWPTVSSTLTTVGDKMCQLF